MINVKLDETNHFTGSYAMVGKVEGGIDVESLPSEPDVNKLWCYKYELHDVITTQIVPVMVTNQETGEVTQQLDENGNPVTTEQTVTTPILGWYLDEIKYNEYILASVKSAKISSLSTICNETIENGADVTTTNGIEHFGFKTDEKKQDQANIKNAYDLAKATNINVFYHADGQECRAFTVQEITNVYAAMEYSIMYNTTKYNALCTWVNRCTTIDEINTIEFTSILPSDLQPILDAAVAQAQQIATAIGATLL